MAWRSACLAAALSLLGNVCHAQVFDLEAILSRGPVRLAIGTDITLRKWENAVNASANTLVVVRNIQSIIDAMIPSWNRGLACARDREFGYEIADLRPVQGGFNSTAPLAISASVRVLHCASEAVYADIRLHDPLIVEMKAGMPTLRRTGLQVDSDGLQFIGMRTLFRWFEIRPFQTWTIGKARTEAEQLFGKTVLKINQRITSFMSKPPLRGLISNYKLKAQSASIAFEGGDLTISVELSGAMSIATANKLLNDI